TSVRLASGERSAASAAWPAAGSTVRTAAITLVQKRTGSFSASSSDSQANGRSSAGEAAQSTSSVVLPDPGGAATSVSLCARDALDAAAAAAGDDALALVADVIDEAALAAAVARAEGAWGGLDVVVVNAATQLTGRDDRPDRLDAEAWRRTIDVNLTGAFLTAK